MKFTAQLWKKITLISAGIFVLFFAISSAIPALQDTPVSGISGLAFLVSAFGLYKFIKSAKKEKEQKQREEYLKLQNELFLKRKADFEWHLENSDPSDQLIIKLKSVKRGDRQENIDNVKIFDKLQLRESIDSDSYDVSSAYGVIGRTNVSEGKKIQELGNVTAYYVERLESDDRFGMKVMVIKN